MTRGLAPTVLVVVLLAVAGGTRALIAHIEAPPDPLRRKAAEADKVLGYVATPGAGPRFRLRGSERTLKLISHAVLPWRDHDPARRAIYGLALRITAAGEALWSEELYTTTRQSKAGRIGEQWRHENAFVSDGSLQLGDARVLLVTLPPEVPAGAELSITLVGDVEEAVVRVWERGERSALARELAEQALTAEDMDEEARLSGYVPWALMPRWERRARLRDRYERMSAVGERGLDYQLRAIYVSSFRSEPPGDADDGALLVTPVRPRAINLRGPARLTIEARAVDGQGALRVTARGDEDAPAPLVLTDDTRTLDLPAGVFTLELTATAPVAARVTGPPAAALTRAPLCDPSETIALVPDEIAVPLHVVGAGGPPVVAAMAAAGHAPEHARVLRVDARVLDVGATPVAFTLRLAVLDGTGRRLGEHERALLAAPAPFDRLEHGENEHTISEPAAVRLLVPPGTAAVQIEASVAAALRLSVYDPGPISREPPYDRTEPLEHRWRYAPLRTRSWWPMAPDNAEALVAAGRRAILRAPVRLTAVGVEPDEAGGDRVAEAVAPDGAPAQQRIVEPVEPAARVGPARAWWRPGMRTVLDTERAVDIDFGAPGRAHIDYEVDAAYLGRVLEVRVNGQVRARQRVRQTRGRLALGRETGGVAPVALRWLPDAPGPAGTGPETWLAVDRPPAGDAPVVRRRTVYPLGPTPLAVTVRRPAGARVVVHAVLYFADPAARGDVLVRATVDGGRPRRAAGVMVEQITLATRTRGLPPAARRHRARLLGAGTPIGYPRLLVVPLGEDLSVGTHVVELSSTRGAPLWVRFFVTGAAPATLERALQWGLGDD